MPANGVQISAHVGDRSATIETFRTAAATGAEYVELDIRAPPTASWCRFTMR